MYTDPNVETVEAQSLKTGDIILIKGSAPRTVNRVEPIPGSVSVKVHFSDGLFAIALKASPYKVVGHDPVYADLQGRLNALNGTVRHLENEGVVITGYDPGVPEGDTLVQYAVTSLQEQFKLLCEDVHTAQVGFPLSSAHIALAKWIYAHRNNIRFD